MCADNVSAAARGPVVEGLLNGLSADPFVFVGPMPRFLIPYREEYDECRALLNEVRAQLYADTLPFEPDRKFYSPLGFGCNFLSNAAVVTVALALDSDNAREQASLNALLTRERDGVKPEASAERLADRLMEFSSVVPERLGAGGVPLITYDAYDAVHCFNEVRRTLAPGAG
jgi:hypothetical protein